MDDDELTRYIGVLNGWIAQDESFAGDLAELAAELRRSGQPALAQTISACSRNFRVTALDLRGQVAAAKPTRTPGG